MVSRCSGEGNFQIERVRLSSIDGNIDRPIGEAFQQGAARAAGAADWYKLMLTCPRTVRLGVADLQRNRSRFPDGHLRRLGGELERCKNRREWGNGGESRRIDLRNVRAQDRNQVFVADRGTERNLLLVQYQCLGCVGLYRDWDVRKRVEQIRCVIERLGRRLI